uniref:Uncharacterized protein n=1 Tax=Ditylenchus dipsaci TaxID=166011 RepID=A0A915DYK8_9BILA
MNLSFFILKLREDEQTTWQMATRHAANPADPVRNPRPKAIVKREEQILKLVTDYTAVDPLLPAPPMPDDEVEVVFNVPVQDPPQQPQNLDDWDMNED